MAATGANTPSIPPDDGALLARLPSDPLVASAASGWDGIAVRHYRHPSAAVEGVSHRDHVVVVHRSGGAALEERLDGTVRHAATAPGAISLTPAGHTVSRRWNAPSDVLLITVDRSLVDQAAADLGAEPARLSLVPRLAAPDGDLHRLGHLLLSHAAHSGRGARLMIDALARALALHLVQRHSTLGALSDATPRRLPPRRIRRVTDYMRANLERPVTVTELAAVAGLSCSHLTRAFRDALGATPYAHLIDLRLAKACELLADRERSITQIAFACGFDQSQHFAATFRRRLGTSPSEWRLSHRE